MARTLQSIMDEADIIISGKMEVKTAAKEVDGVTELADQLKASSPVTEYTMTEKVAYARAVLDTILNLDYLTKVAELEDRAAKSGIPGEKVAEYFEKKAGMKFRSVLDLVNA